MLGPKLIHRDAPAGVVETRDRMVVDVGRICSRRPRKQCEGIEELKDPTLDVCVLHNLNGVWDASVVCSDPGSHANEVVGVVVGFASFGASRFISYIDQRKVKHTVAEKVRSKSITNSLVKREKCDLPSRVLATK